MKPLWTEEAFSCTSHLIYIIAVVMHLVDPRTDGVNRTPDYVRLFCPHLLFRFLIFYFVLFCFRVFSLADGGVAAQSGDGTKLMEGGEGPTWLTVG